MPERRTTVPRQRTFKSGTIEFNRAGGITSIVKNLSDTGAMLQVEASSASQMNSRSSFEADN